uniref:Uncharacterized protein n=1 Tax=Anguilla anguilla TaxID=7936 RepID=A0A0E9TGC7_ANGAN
MVTDPTATTLGEIKEARKLMRTPCQGLPHLFRLVSAF